MCIKCTRTYLRLSQSAAPFFTFLLFQLKKFSDQETPCQIGLRLIRFYRSSCIRFAYKCVKCIQYAYEVCTLRACVHKFKTHRIFDSRGVQKYSCSLPAIQFAFVFLTQFFSSLLVSICTIVYVHA